MDINKIYESKGYQNRKDFIKSLSDDVDVSIEKALNICDNEYFNRLIYLLSNIPDEGKFDEFVKDLSKKEMQESQKRLLYDDDKYLQKVYQEILKEE